MAHQMNVSTRSGISRAVCSCGWSGPERQNEVIARRDQAEHIGANPTLKPQGAAERTVRSIAVFEDD